MNIPDGFAAVTPYFIVADPEAYSHFLVSAFAAIELNRTESQGEIINIICEINGARFFIGKARDLLPTCATYYLYVEDADTCMQQAVQAGGEQIMEIMDMSYGDRQGGLKDPAGNLWWISQRLSTEDYF